MADPKQPATEDLPLAANGEVKAYDRYGNKITVPKDQVGQLYGMGGRVAKRAEVDAVVQQEKYDKQSTAEKVAIHASMLGPIGYIPHAALRAHGVVAAPEVEAYTQGVSQGFTGGAASVGMKEAIEVLGDKQAAKAYGETARVTSEAHSGLHTAGEVAGFLGGAASSPIGRAGGVVEGLAARGTAGLAARGVAGRAAASAINLGARGAAEGAIYGAAQQTSADMLGDREIAGDKVFAAMGLGALAGGLGGAALGGAGSLAMSGARGVGSKLVSGLARSGEEAATAEASKLAAVTGEAGAEAVAKGETKSTLAKILGTKTNEPIREIAQERAFRASGARKAFVTEANARVDGGTKAIGEMMLRRGVISAEDGALQGVIRGNPEGMLPRAAAELESVGKRIGELTDASPATITAGEVEGAVNTLVKEYSRNAATRPAAQSLEAFSRTLGETLGISSAATTAEGMAAARAQTVPVQRLLEERRALSNLVFEGTASLNPTLQVEIKQKLARELEGLITKAMDNASGKVPGEFAAEYKALKGDYQKLRILNDALEDSINRGTANRTFSLTDKIVGSAAGGAGSLIGGPIGGLVAGPGAAAVSKIVRERGDAAIALLLNKAADMATLTKTVRAVDDQIGRAAAGMVTPPKAKPLPTPSATEPPRMRAEKAIEALTELQANPHRITDMVTRNTESMHASAPELAGVVQTRAVQALAFIATKVPVHADHDPLDPHPAPKMSDGEAASFMRTVEYANRPIKFFEDLEHGKLTFEGAEAARALMPGAFADLQSRMLDQLADLRTRGITPPYQQRQMIGAILNIPATPSQRPDHMAFLQKNVEQSAAMLQQQQQQAGKTKAPLPKRPLPTKPQHSALDRLEGR